MNNTWLESFFPWFQDIIYSVIFYEIDILEIYAGKKSENIFSVYALLEHYRFYTPSFNNQKKFLNIASCLISMPYHYITSARNINLNSRGFSLMQDMSKFYSCLVRLFGYITEYMKVTHSFTQRIDSLSFSFTWHFLEKI